MHEPVEKCSVEDIARSGGVDRVHAEAGAENESRSIPRQHAETPERRARQAALEVEKILGSDFSKIFLAGESRRGNLWM